MISDDDSCGYEYMSDTTLGPHYSMDDDLQ